jgi:hypothetical protein
MLDIIRRPDVRLRSVIRVQGLENPWTHIDDSSNHLGYSTKPIIANRTLAPTYGSVTPFEGIASSGHMAVELSDRGGYLAGLFSSGVETVLTADVEPGDSTINVESTAAFASSGTIRIHREAIDYTGKTATTFTGCSRAQYEHVSGVYAPPHRISATGGPEGDGVVAAVRVGTTPLYLEGRYISLYVTAEDYAGNPVQDADGNSTWEIWRGIITSVPPSPTGIGYSLRAETLERLITDDPPPTGLSGELVSGAWRSSWGGGEQQKWGQFEAPIFVPWGRRHLAVKFIADNLTAGTLTEYPVSVNVLSENHGQFMTLGQIAEAFQASAVGTITQLESVSIGYNQQFEIIAADGEVHEHDLGVIFTFGPTAGDDINWRVELLHGDLSLWQQLGFTDNPSSWWYTNLVAGWAETTAADGATIAGRTDMPPATIMVMPGDDEIPVLSNATVTPSAGWVKIGDEFVYYEGTEDAYVIDGVQAYILTGCKRGYAGTMAGEYIYRMGSDDAPDLPDVEPAYCVGGNGTPGADAPDNSVWISLLAVLTGTNNDGTNGDYTTWPGLGIPEEHLDVESIARLADSIPMAGPLYGSVSDLRSWLSDAIALEGYALVTRPLSDGTCRLTPVRQGAANAGESVLTVDIDAAEGVTVSGGLSSIINRVNVESPRSEAHYTDLDSVAQFGVRQAKSYKIPAAATEGGVLYVANSARRIFALTGNRRYMEIDCSLSPEARGIAPGDVIDLTLPNNAMSGRYKVLEASTPLRGRGSVTVKALWVGGLWSYIYTPATEIQSVSAPDVDVDTSDGQWFSVGDYVWVYDPDDYGTGVSRRVDAVDGDTVTLNSAAGISAGWVMEMDDYTTNPTDTEHVYLVSSSTQWQWGD